MRIFTLAVYMSSLDPLILRLTAREEALQVLLQLWLRLRLLHLLVLLVAVPPLRRRQREGR